MFKRIDLQKVLTGATALTAAATPAFAVDTTVTDLFTAASFTTISAGIGTILLAGLGMRMLMIGYKWVKRTTRSA